MESVRTPKPRVQGQGISPVCDFASRPATEEQTAFRLQPVTSFQTRSDELPARSRYPSTSFPLADHQSRQDKRTRDALFTRAPPNNKDKRIQQRSTTMFGVFLCPTRNTLFLTTVKRLWITHHQVRAVCEAESNVQCTTMACGFSP